MDLEKAMITDNLKKSISDRPELAGLYQSNILKRKLIVHQPDFIQTDEGLAPALQSKAQELEKSIKGDLLKQNLSLGSNQSN